MSAAINAVLSSEESSFANAFELMSAELPAPLGEKDMEEYFSGGRLWGDDMSPAQILAWYRDEENSYLNMQATSGTAYVYGYHTLNWLHGYRFLPPRNFDSVLSFGGAYGDEVRPVAARTRRIVIVEPAAYSTRELDGTPVEYRKSVPSGRIPGADCEFDLITCLGALHHVPNVSTIIGEFMRVLAPRGLVLIREPIVTQGDWRAPRRGLTLRERGIPHAYFRRVIAAAGFTVLSEQRCTFPLTSRLGHLFGVQAYNSLTLTKLDAALSALTPWRTKYHPTTWWHKLQPSSVFYVLTK